MSTTLGAVRPAYPVRVEAQLDPQLSRWLWLAKWLLVIPHYIVLAFLWIAFFALSIAAFIAILFTGRYPRSIFEFNVGVLRWSWRVSYYAYGALATDRYPPFTLAEVPDYPAKLEIAYPERLSRGLVLIKWFLGIPHYLIVGLFVGGLWFGWQSGHIAGGLISLLALVAGVVLAFTARYPESIFDLVLGLNRWVLRVAAYGGLMTDQYPPFRLDVGGSEPGAGITVSPPSGSSTSAPALPTSPSQRGWGAGRVLAVVFGAILVLPSLGALAGGGALLWAHTSERDVAGYLNTGTETFRSETFAITSERIALREEGWAWVRSALGTVRVRVSGVDAGTDLFVGIARQADVESYLSNVAHAETTDLTGSTRTIGGTAVPARPGDQSFWVASSTGTGTRTVTWQAEGGDWSIVAMNADGSRGVAVDASVGATVPALRNISIGLLIGGGVLFILSLGLLIGGVASRPKASTPEGGMR
jgi:hypothetical protein